MATICKSILCMCYIIWFYSKLLKQSPLRQQKALATRNVIKKKQNVINSYYYIFRYFILRRDQ